MQEIQLTAGVLMGTYNRSIFPGSLAAQIQERHANWSHSVHGLGSGLGSSGEQILRIYATDSVADEVPHRIKGIFCNDIKTTIVVCDVPRAQYFTERERPIRPGASISHINADNNQGSACVAVKRANPKYTYLLSCEHVLFNGLSEDPDRGIVQPAASDGETEIAALRFDRGGLMMNGINEIDAAIAELDPNIGMINVPLGAQQQISGVSGGFSIGQQVKMIGRTSGVVEGPITDTNMHTFLDYKAQGINRPLRFHNIVQANYPNEGGDSGAPIVLASNGKLIGMHIAGDGEFGYFCKIERVFSKLQLRLA